MLLSAGLFCAGCASPGPPKPPSLQLPELVKDISVERSGDQVLLRWTTPSRTTDDMEIRGTMTAQVCRETGATAAGPSPAKLAVCAPVRRLQVAPGPSEMTDTLPPPLLADPVKLIAYRIQIFNSAGRSAGNSAAAYAAAGQTPAAIAHFEVKAAEQGAVLEWQSVPAPATEAAYLVDLKRTDLTPPPPPEKKAKPAAGASSGAFPGKNKPVQQKPAGEPPDEVHLRASDAPVPGSYLNTAGTVDTTAVMGGTYTYTAQRVRAVTIGDRHLEIASSPSAALTLTMRDTFPPKPPAGLATISGTIAPYSTANAATPQPYIDLSWEPNSEPDLAGYRVYRQLARPDGSPQGPLARLTALPTAVPAYRDVAVKAGQGYIYSVTAVDAAGNESAPSAKALEFVSEAGSGAMPDVEQPPH